jgi:hypothetical protein
MPTPNPCLTCGACCAAFRVSFYWAETDRAQGGMVPLEMTEEVTPFRRAMRGTNQPYPRCIALQGPVGGLTNCVIYAHRSTTCRNFGLTWEAGVIHASP